MTQRMYRTATVLLALAVPMVLSAQQDVSADVLEGVEPYEVGSAVPEAVSVQPPS